MSTRLPSLLSRVAAGLTASAVLAGLLGTAQPTPVAAASACVNGWREMNTPDSVFLSTAFDIVTRNGKEAWILGGTNSGVLALRWTGSSWKQTAKSSSGHRGLVGGATVGHNRVLGVGYYRPFLGNTS